MNKVENFSSIPENAEAFAISQLFTQKKDKILYIGKDDREIINIQNKWKILWIL